MGMSAFAFAYLVRDDAKPILASSVGSVPRHTLPGVWRESDALLPTTATAHTDHIHATGTLTHTRTRTHTYAYLNHTSGAGGRLVAGEMKVRVWMRSQRRRWARLHPSQEAAYPGGWLSAATGKSRFIIFLFWSILIPPLPFCHHVPAYTGCFWSCWGKVRGHIVISQGGRGGLHGTISLCHFWRGFVSARLTR